MTLLVPKNIQSNYFNYYVQLPDFCLLHYFLQSDSKADTLYNAITPYSIFKTFNKKTKLVIYSIILRAIPLGLALLYKYYPLTMENIVVVFIPFFLFYIQE